MPTWCLIPTLAEKFKEGLRSGDIDPENLAKLDTKGRREFLTKYVGENNALRVNALFESKMLLKNQQKGYITWAKQVSGISPQVRQDLISRIERMDKVLSPSENQQFLEDLASTRLRIDINKQEAQRISDLSNKSLELRLKANEEGKFPTENDRLAYGIARVNLESYVNELKLKSREISFKEQPLRKVVDAISSTPGVMKSIVASLDNSFWGRQGMKTLADVRTSKIWFRNFLKSWGDIKKELGGVDAMQAIKADVYSRPNALNGKYDAGNYGLGVLTEEAFPSSFPERIPAFGRLFKASESAYNGAAIRLRADLADRIIKIADAQGINTLQKDEARPLGALVRSITGRGDTGKFEPLSKEINVLLFSLKFMKSNIDTLIAPAKYVASKTGLRTPSSKGAALAEKEAAKNTLSMIASMAAVLTIAKLLDPDSVDTDRQSTNFGKIKIFGHWVDITGGLSAYITLLSRVTPSYHDGKLSFWSKSSTGVWTDLKSGEFGGQNALDTVESFFEGKLSPFAGVVRDIWKNRNFQGEVPTLENILPNIAVPISIQNFNQLKDDPNSGNVLGSMILDMLGLSTSTYKPKANWDTSTSVKLKQFKEKVGEEKFQKANEDFNRAYNDWVSGLVETDLYKSLSDDAKANIKADGKQIIQEKIFKEYKFEYKKPADTKEEAKLKEELKKLLPDKVSEAPSKDTMASIVQGIGKILTAVSTVASAEEAEKKLRSMVFMTEDGEERVRFIYDKNGRYVEENKPLFERRTFSFLGKILHDLGSRVNLPELRASEWLGYRTKEQRIQELQDQYNDFIDKSMGVKEGNRKDLDPDYVDYERVKTVVPEEGKKDADISIPGIETALKKEGIFNKKVLAYALATTQHETASTMRPVNEGFYNDEKYGYEPGFTGRSEAKKRGYSGGENYYGRGYIQLTHDYNYRELGRALKIDLVNDPELANNPDIAAKILAKYFKRNGIDLTINDGKIVEARKKVNPDDKGEMIKNTYEKYLSTLE